MGFEGTVRHPRSLNFRLFFGPFLHAVPLRLGLAEGALALAARPWRVFLVGFEGTVRHPPSVPVRSLFRRFLHAVPLRLGPAGGWAAPWLCLSCSCACCRALAARPWRVFLVGFEGTVRHPLSLNFRFFFGPFLHAVPLRLGLAEGALAGCALAVP